MQRLPLRRTLKSSRSRTGYDEQWDDEEERDDGPESEEFGEEEPLEPTDIFADYRPSKLKIGKPHPDPVVETASLAAVEPPDISYKLHLQVYSRANIKRIATPSLVSRDAPFQQTGFFPVSSDREGMSQRLSMFLQADIGLPHSALP